MSGLDTKIKKSKILKTSGYSLDKLSRIITMTPDRVWNSFILSGVLASHQSIPVALADKDFMNELATSPAFLVVYRTYHTIEHFVNKACEYFLADTMTAFGPKLMTYGPNTKPTTPNHLFVSTQLSDPNQMKAGLLAMQDELIEVLKQLVTDPEDVYKMIAYIQEGDFFDKVLQFTKEAGDQEYIVFQRKFEECICELVSEIMIALPGGFEQAPTLLTTYEPVIKVLHKLLKRFTGAYVELIKAQCN
jgi:hypothetical protein